MEIKDGSASAKRRPAWCQHPLILGLACGAAAFLAATIFVATIPPAWAVSFPVGNLFVVELGELPPWITAIVFLLTWWEAHRAKKIAKEGVVKIDAVATQIDGLLVDRDKSKVREGEVKGKLAGEATAATLAEGQRQGAASERASVAAANPTAMPVPTDGKKPLPVADDRTAHAAERSAAAQERTAAATEEKKP